MTATPDQDLRQQERERYSKAIRALYASFKNIRLYSPNHPTVKESSQKFVSTLENVFQARFDFSLRHLDGLFVIDDFLFIEESLSFYDLLRALETRRLAKFSFLPGVTPDEITACNTYLLNPNTVASKQAPLFSSPHINATPSSNTEEKVESVGTRLLFERSSALYGTWLDLTQKTFKHLLEDQNVSLADLSIPLDLLIDALTQRPSDFSLMLASRQSNDLVRHSLHTMIQSIFLGQQMGFDPPSVKTLALAALFHDVGRFLLPSNLTTENKINPDDAAIIQSHGREGALLLAGVLGLPTSVMRAALEHHAGYDGLGYPSLPTSQKPHIYSQIIGLADFVSWATIAENRYQKSVPLHRILRVAMRRAGTQFSPLLVKLLLPFFGLYPPGTKVRLTVNDVAVCIVPDPAHIGRPLVLVEDVVRKTWVPRRLDTVTDNGLSFPASIQRVVGFHTDVESLLAFLPD